MVTAPGIGVEKFNDLRPQRVLMNILYETNEIGIPIAKNGLVPALEEMPDRAIFPVKVHGIGLVHALHSFGERDIRGLDEQMHMVVHQDVRIDAATSAILVDCECEEVLLEISCVLEYTLLLVAPDDDMIEGAGKLYARLARHEESIATRQR